jgi:DeoR/GlpR family transcriptional regulator of sugar metabolism
MTAGARRKTIADMVRGGEMSVADLAAAFGVTASTIRRDLALLAAEGKVVRTFSGATSLGGPSGAEPTTDQRARTSRRVKHRIAARARELVEPDTWVYLDAGTTCAGLAHRLVDAAGLTVVTPSLLAIRALGPADDVTVLGTGGRLRRVSEAFVGRESERLLRHVSIDVAFLSADAVHPRRGLLEVEPDQIALKEAAVAASRQVVVLADATKFTDEAPTGYWLPWPQGAVLITDADAAALPWMPPHVTVTAAG